MKNDSTLSASHRPERGFTLVEIMIVVVIIGLLAAMGIPAFEKVRTNSLASRIANDFRVFSGAFETHALEVGMWPPDGNFNSLPASAQPYLEGTAWTQSPMDGGYWDWEGVGRHGFTASVNLHDGNSVLSAAVVTRVDELLDDGNLSSGNFRQVGGSNNVLVLQF